MFIEYKNNEHLFFYSVNTDLAHYINEKFYNGLHYIWCTDCFNKRGNPPSSNPRELYIAYRSDVSRGDTHSEKISKNKLGLLKGAKIMRDNGKITEKEFEEIKFIVGKADMRYFEPLLYIIDKSRVKDKVKTVPRNERANPMSDEYKIADLCTNEFDVISFEDEEVC